MSLESWRFYLPCGEQLSDDGCFEAVLHEAEGSPETGATGAHHNRVIGVVHDGVLSGGSSIGWKKRHFIEKVTSSSKRLYIH